MWFSLQENLATDEAAEAVTAAFGVSGRISGVKQKGVSVKEHGVVKWFNGAKGYGFIQRSTGEDVFVHFSAILDNGYKTLNEGEGVEFECQQGPKGLNAANVTRNA
ncbi:MAG TPA: cold-shock protein [Alloacidobacterium sp.]|nr:cold-shock protein [Alloacidobacterium sp.]